MDADTRFAPALRMGLLACAILCGTSVAVAGVAFGLAVEPESGSILTTAFWWLIGMLVAAPLWIPAGCATRTPAGFRLCRRVCAVGLLLPTAAFGGLVVHAAQRGLSGQTVATSVVAQGLVPLLACVAGLAILLGTNKVRKD